MTSIKPSVLIFTDWYVPGYKAGGPIRSCLNMVQLLQTEYRFHIVTADRDLGDRHAYEDITLNSWINRSENENIYYASPGTLTSVRIKDIISEIMPSVVYLNSMFSPVFTLRPLWVLRKLKYPGTIVLAPRGMLKASALSHKPLKKRLFLLAATIFGFSRSIVFHCIDEQEKKEVRARLGKNAITRLASNIPLIPSDPHRRIKHTGELNIVFVSRIHPVKNLLFALDVLSDVADLKEIKFDIYGAVDDESYYKKCFERARLLSNRVTVQFMGTLNFQEMQSVLQQYHLFFLPTKGENFGHAIFEALSSGCPVLISDQTPWKFGDNATAGWSFPSTERKKFADTIRFLHNLPQDGFTKLSAEAFEFANNFFLATDYKKQYRQLFIKVDE